MLLLGRRKKHLRDDRLLRLIMLLVILRGSPDDLLGWNEETLFNTPMRDLPLGTSFGQAHLPYGLTNSDMHPKSLDRMLASYQHALIEDIYMLGYYDEARYMIHTTPLQAYLLNVQLNTVQETSEEQEQSANISETNSLLSSARNENSGDTLLVGNDFISEDLALIDTLWKQDIDLGVSRDYFDEDDKEIEAFRPFTKEKDFYEEPPGGTTTECEDEGNDVFLPMLNVTVDSETGELLAHDSESGIFSNQSLCSPNYVADDSENEFQLDLGLEDSIHLAGLPSPTVTDNLWKSFDAVSFDSRLENDIKKDFEDLTETGEDFDSLEALNSTLDDMIQASQLHHHRSFQGRFGGLVRGGSMEQRWHDLASLLSLSSSDASAAPPQLQSPAMATSHIASPHAIPPPPIHHPHALYPTTAHDGGATGPPRGVLLHNVTLPPLNDPMTHSISYSNSIGASSHLVPNTMNLTSSPDLPPAATDPGHYKMETSTPVPSADMMYYHPSSSSEMNQTSSESFLTPILNDEELQLMDMAITDYNGRSSGPGGEYSSSGYRYPQEDTLRIPSVAQKKHHMFGKRYFHDSPHGGSLPATGSALGAVGGYPPQYPTPGPPPTAMEGTTTMDSDMKYSCAMDFRPTPTDIATVSTLDHVHHNHTYPIHSEGPSGLVRSSSREKHKGKKSENERPLSRDEKRARLLNLPIMCEEIINLPMDEFNERISKYDLTEEQLSLIRDIRRRGKNKVAAQNCRKRKLDQILSLADDVKRIQQRKFEMLQEFEYLQGQRERFRRKYAMLHRHIFQSLRDPDGNQYSPHEYSLQQSADGSVLLVPRPSQSLDQMGIKSHHVNSSMKDENLPT